MITEAYQNLFRAVGNDMTTQGNKPACSQCKNVINLLGRKQGEMAKAGTGKETEGYPGKGC